MKIDYDQISQIYDTYRSYSDTMIRQIIEFGNLKDEMTILELANVVLKLTKSKSEIEFLVPKDARTADDPTRRCPDISKARRVLKWKPKVKLEDGLGQTIDHFRHLQERA